MLETLLEQVEFPDDSWWDLEELLAGFSHLWEFWTADTADCVGLSRILEFWVWWPNECSNWWYGSLAMLLVGDLVGSLTWKEAEDIDLLLLRFGPALELWLSVTCFLDLEKKPLSSSLPWPWLFTPLSEKTSQDNCSLVDFGGAELLLPPLDADDLKKNSFFMVQYCL